MVQRVKNNIRLLWEKWLRLRLFISGRPVVANLGWMRIEWADPRDSQTLAYILNGCYYHRMDLETFHGLVKPGDTVLDIGANVGFTAAELALMAGAHGRVFAVEPGRATFTRLVRNAALNPGLNITPLNYACGSKSGSAVLNFNPEMTGHSSLLNQAGPEADRETVQVKTLDQIVEENRLQRVDFMKMDVEGFESEVLSGAKETLRRFKPALVFEVNPNYPSQSEAAYQILESNGYSMSQPVDEILRKKQEVNVIARPGR